MRHTALRAFLLTLGVIGWLGTGASLAEAASAWYCLQPPRQSCAEYPIVTHWVATSGGGYFDLTGVDADSTRLQRPQLQYQNYDGMTTDTYAPTDQDATNFLTAVEQATGVPVYMYNYDGDTALGKLQEAVNRIQVIHNVWVPVQPPRLTSLFTFIFPPGWVRTSQYPILLSGDGGGTSNNGMAFLAGWEQTRAIATYVGQSTQQGRTGLIAALSNTGGRESAGWHANALNDVAAMLTYMQLNGYGVDRNKVVHFGGSRGGGTALLWGENPLGLPDYTSIGVFAMSPPSHGGFNTQQAVASYQGFAALAISFFNDPTADRYNHVPRLIDVNPAPLLKLVVDEDHPWKVDCPPEDCPADTNRKSPAAYLSRLAGQPVVISLGTHDSGPLPMILKMDRTLRYRWGIPRLLCLTLRTGHKGDATDCPRAEVDRFLLALVTPGQSYAVPNTRRYFKATNLTDHPFGSAVGLPDPTTLPFSITVPYRAAPFQWATLAACGETRKSYTATLTNSAGQVAFSVSKTFGVNTTIDWRFDGTPPELDPECDVIRLDQRPGWTSLPPGTYTWAFTFDGRAINPGNLSYVGASNWGRPTVATTIIDPSQPPLQDAIFDPEAAITMGVDEF